MVYNICGFLPIYRLQKKEKQTKTLKNTLFENGTM